MVAFLANEDEAARRYAEWTGKTCRDIGLRFELRQVTRTQLEEAIIEANEDDGVNGIMVYYPVFGDAMDQYLQNIVDPAKDVEGLCHTYRFYMYHNIRHLDEAKTQRCIIPCTPLAIVKFLEHMGIYNSKLPYGDRLHGRTVTVINRSEVVGRPLAALLANDGAHVYSADVNGLLELNRGQGLHLKRYLTNECSLTLEEALARSDIVIGGVPAKAYKIPTAQLREGVVAINLSSVANFEDDITSKASFFVSSVGKVTTVMLERNLMRLWQYQRKARAEAEVKETDAEADAVAEEEQAAKAYA
ncbi:hypothetical protein CXG81DRAFT_29382 [Caulochytrium protostelioides]|uniref:NAD(P)-binding protein n=1 Tax=Caulochytrium protostelioides TaxID=1555241 RepID=A0A4P9XCY6_9FUNG|nr:hypothetical protein CXG81DRAFT_29382 [Caulochytrium protostelioides]|eukprot:RKP03030.1 hypothetical protein CXG81DRAFT_29382 [Caulochytrium protostelioides]